MNGGALVVELRDLRTARRATEVLRGLLGRVQGVSGVAVRVNEGRVVVVVTVHRVRSEVIRACIPSSVNSVPVVVRSN